jgi:hypothetical protein
MEVYIDFSTVVIVVLMMIIAGMIIGVATTRPR